MHSSISEGIIPSYKTGSLILPIPGCSAVYSVETASLFQKNFHLAMLEPLVQECSLFNLF